MKTTYGKKGILRETNGGEDMPVMVIDVDKSEDFSMKKLWYLILSEQCGLGRGTQKEKVVKWIIDNLDSEDRVIVTQRKLAEKLGVSIVTVSETMSILQKGENPFLIRMFSGVYTINPKIAYKGEENSNKFAFIYQIKGTDKADKAEAECKDEEEIEVKEEEADDETEDTEADMTEEEEETTAESDETETEETEAEDFEEESNEEQTEC